MQRMIEPMKHYDAYLLSFRKTHISEIYIRIGPYVATIQQKIRGKAMGAGILWSALSFVDNWNFSASDVTVGYAEEGEDGTVKSITLIHEDLYHEGTKDPRTILPIFIDDEKDRAMLAQHIVGVQIVDWKEDEIG